MTQNIKPLLEQLKEQLKNREELREKLVQNLENTKALVETAAKGAWEQSKDSKLVNEYIFPLLESEKTDQAIQFLNEKLGSAPILGQIEKVRQDLIKYKSDRAREVTPAEEESVKTKGSTQAEANAAEPSVSNQKTESGSTPVE